MTRYHVQCNYCGYTWIASWYLNKDSPDALGPCFRCKEPKGYTVTKLIDTYPKEEEENEDDYDSENYN